MTHDPVQIAWGAAAGLTVMLLVALLLPALKRKPPKFPTRLDPQRPRRRRKPAKGG